jgi:uridine kinase
MPGPGSAARVAVVEAVAATVADLGQRRVTLVIDGLTAAGKTSFGHEVGRALAADGRQVLRASLDDFKRPWRDRDQYDRVSGEGYYRNAFDYPAVWRLLLDPARPGGTGSVVLCSIDPITQIDHSSSVVAMDGDGVLIVDGVFVMRPELDDAWDLRVWVDVDAELSVVRGAARDASREGGDRAAEELHRTRYLASELLYIDECDPIARADIVVDNRNFDSPRLFRI